MNLDRFVTSRSPQWSELDELLATARGRTQRLSPRDVIRLGDAYRVAAADLAVARRDYPNAAVTQRLETLVRDTHLLLYAKASRSETLRHYLSTTLWQRIRSLSWLLALSAGIIFFSTALGVLWALTYPASAVAVVPGAHVDAHSTGAFYGISLGSRLGLAQLIFVNNIIVALLVIAGGFTFGVLSVLSLGYNGLLLGVLGTLEWRVGGFSDFLRLVVPHGLLELSCFTLAGAAGLSIARCLIDPGRRTRTDALADAAPRTGAGVIATVIFLVVAGCVEGVITPFDLSLGVALAVGITLCGLFWALVIWRGRPERLVEEPPRQATARDFIVA